MTKDPKTVVRQLMRAAAVSAMTMIGCVGAGAAVGWVLEGIVDMSGWGIIVGVLGGVFLFS